MHWTFCARYTLPIATIAWCEMSMMIDFQVSLVLFLDAVEADKLQLFLANLYKSSNNDDMTKADVVCRKRIIKGMKAHHMIEGVDFGVRGCDIMNMAPS